MLIYFVFSLSFLSCTLATDYTMVPGGRDQDMVCAVIDKISDSGIFSSDQNMLRRIAYVETKFGAAQDTYHPDYHGGMWKVDRTVFDYIMAESNSNLDHLWQELTSKLLMKPKKQIEWTDLRKPLFSGVFARLRLHLNGVSIPQRNKIHEQAKYWKYNYNSAGNENDFVNRVDEMNNKFGSDCNVCLGRMNLAIVMDGSGSIGDKDYGFAKHAANNLIDTFSTDLVDIGYVLFSSGTEVLFPLKSNLTRDAIKDRVKNSKYPSGGTQTDKGIKVASQLLGQADTSMGIPIVMVIFTDGMPDSASSAISAAGNAKQSNITIFTVGIGSNIDQKILKQLASRESYVMPVASYENLIEFGNKINSETCKVPQKPPVGVKVENDQLAENEKRFFWYPLPNEGITLKIDNKVGKTQGYISYTVENPSSAINDGEFSKDTFIASPKSISGRIKRDAEGTSSVYITIQGLENNNTYSLESLEGNHATGAGHHSKSTGILVAITSIIIFANI